MWFEILIKEFFDKLRYSKGSGGVLARGAVGVFIVKSAGGGVLFGLHVMLARILGVEQYGIYVYAITWIDILAIICLLGFQTSLVRFIAEYNIKQQWALLRGILRKSNQFVLGFSALVSLVGMVVIRFLNERMAGESAVTFYLALAVLPVLTLCHLREACLRALKRVVQSELLLRVIRPVVMGLIVIGLFLWIGESLNSQYAMAANLIAIVCVAVVGTILLHILLPEAVGKTKPVLTNKQWLKVSLPLLLVAGMQIILKRTDIVMIGILLGSGDAGTYSAASRVSDLVVFALITTNVILAPMVSELYHAGQKEELKKLITLVARVVFVFTLVISLILIIFGKFVLSLFGLAFIAAYIPLLILLAGQMVNAFSGPVGLIMSMGGRQNMMGIIVSISAATNILLNFALIPFWGLTGAAISTAFTMVMWNVAMLRYVKKYLGINSTIISKGLQ